jgi:site-specific DNA-methyltransferase (adenine-specific)
MRTFKDKEFDLAIVDPPYGSDNIERTGGTWSKKYDRDSKIKKWDYKPNQQYFDELLRISKNQIIWGGNYFTENLKNNRCFLIWKKHIPENFTLSMCEYAWTSFDKNAKLFEFASNREGNRIHPTQKPYQLYDWLLKNYANENNKILDTHLGSGSIAIAIDKANTLDKKNLTFVGIELDTDYFNAATERFKVYKMQQSLF